MSLYIKSENQELLWRTIHKTPLIDNYFRTLVPGSREVWFQEIVKSFHIKNPSIMNQDALARVNRDTIAYMVSILRTPMSSSQQIPTQQQSQPHIQTNPIGQVQNTEYREPTTIYSRGSTTATRDEFAEKFTNRQKEYESMLQKPAIPEVKFSEKMEDGVIQNMDELIKQQLKQRELDIANYSPLPPVGVGPPINMATLSSSSSILNLGSRKLSIGEDIKDSHIESIPLGASPPDPSQPLSNGKRVTFELSDPLTDRFRELESRVRELEAILLQSSQQKVEKEIEEKNITE